MQITCLRADPAGNITILVPGETAPSDRAGLAVRLMELLPGAEQVGFFCPPQMGGEGRLEMMGGEFCGNAARCFGLVLAQRRGFSGPVRVEISGAGRPLTVTTCLETMHSSVELPAPYSVEPITLAKTPCRLVSLPGIVHAVCQIPGADALSMLDALEQRLAGYAAAFGVMLLSQQKEQLRMTPVVRVPAAGSTVWESSCGSGSVAAAAVLSESSGDGEFRFALHQPGGVIEGTAVRCGGDIRRLEIGGPVTVGEPVTVCL